MNNHSPHNLLTAADVKARVNIGDLAGLYRLQTRKSGRRLVCRCVCGRNSDRNPSFNLYPDNGSFYCFACNTGGDIFTLVGLIEDCDFRAAFEKITRWFNLSPTAQTEATVRIVQRMEPVAPDKTVSAETRMVLTATAKHYADQLWQSPEALAYVRRRGLSDDTIHRLLIGYAPGNTLARAMFDHGIAGERLLEIGLYSARGREKFAGYVVLPVLDASGAAVYLQGRSPETNPRQKHESLPEGLAHKQPMVCGRPVRGTIITEGAFDYATLVEWGLDAEYRLIALLGTAHRQALTLLGDNVQSPVVLALDQDSPGKQAAVALAELLTAQGKTVRIPIDADRWRKLKTQASSDPAVQQELTNVQRMAERSWAIRVHWQQAKDLNELQTRAGLGQTAFESALIFNGGDANMNGKRN